MSLCECPVIADALFTGDAFIPGIKTVTNLPGGKRAHAAQSLELIQCLATNRIIFSGHKTQAIHSSET